ncbi:MAG: alpha/beta hydrolase [Gammaproteobacteria bacterium]|nr:alpha/beta hydrolase [Gammaproteobacteria bacterium]
MSRGPRPSPPAALHYVQAGDGVPLVLLHGIGATHEDFESQIPVFSREFRVIAPDLRGYGDSPPGDDYRIESFAGDVWALLQRLGVDRFNLLGHSMGGAVAMRMAADQPRRIIRLVLADTLPSFVADTLGKSLMYVYRRMMMRIFGPRRLSLAVAANLFPRPEQAALRARVAARNVRHSRRVYLQTLDALYGWSIEDQLHRLTMPTLLLAAEHDYFPEADARAFAARLPNARLLLIAGAHHALPLEVPAAFNRAVLEFLRG